MMFLCPLKIVFILENNADPDGMPYYLGLHCLPKYLFEGIQNEKGKINCVILHLYLHKQLFFAAKCLVWGLNLLLQ